MTRRRVFLVLELADHSAFDPTSDIDLDELADAGLVLIHGVESATAYGGWEDLNLEEGPKSGR